MHLRLSELKNLKDIYALEKEEKNNEIVDDCLKNINEIIKKIKKNRDQVRSN